MFFLIYTIKTSMKKSFRNTKPSGFKDSRKSGGGNFAASMHKATCSDCGKQCEVPFKPTGNRPIFCSMCFQKDGSSNYKRPNRMDSGRSVGGERQSYKADSNKYESRNTDNVGEQFRIVNSKLDAILKALR